MNHPLRANGRRIIMYVHGWRRSGVPAVMLGGRYGSHFAHGPKKEYDIFVVLSRVKKGWKNSSLKQVGVF
jgi:hypothetical protein